MKKPTKKQRLQQMRIKRLLLISGLAIVVFSAVAYTLIRLATPTQPQRLVTFYDRGTKHSILTTATTVRGALMAAAITIDPHDVVDPTVDTYLSKTYIDIIIYRSRPVAITDGGVRQTVMTSQQSPNEILQAAGLKALGSKDTTSFTQDDLVLNGAQTQLVVSRAKLIVPPHVSFQPTPNALTVSKGAHIYIDNNGVAHRETYYDLPMNVAIKSCGAANTYTIRSDGAKVDQDGYILVAANLAAYPRCTIVDTSMGPGKVYDTGGFAVRYPYGFDLATDWTNYNGS